VQPAPPPVPPGGQRPPAAGGAQPGRPRPAKGKGALIALVVAVVVVLVGGGVFAYRQWSQRDAVRPAASGATSTQPAVVTAAPTVAPTAAAPSGFSTPEEAVEADLEQGWLYKLATDGTTTKEYWVGEPASEWSLAYTVEQAADGGWSVTSVEPLGAAAPSGEDEAVTVVKRFLTAIKQGRTLDAQSLTIEPLHSDAASAQDAGGEFLSFRIDRTASAKNDGWWVYATLEWTYGTERWRYRAVPTDAGYRIDTLTAW
jgi:hypothetical protein